MIISITVVSKWWRGRDSNPRPLGYEPNELPLLHPAAQVVGRMGAGRCPQRPRLPRGRPRSTLRRCPGSRPGSGWVRVEPERSRPRTPPRLRDRPRQLGGAPLATRAAPSGERGVLAHGMGHDENPPSAMSTGRLRSVTGRPPPASLPGRLPGAFLLSNGEPRLGAGFPLRCFQRFAHPDVATQRCRLPDNWLTSGPSSPVLSY